MTTQRKDHELGVVIIVGSLFSITLLFVDIFYSNWGGMFQDLFVAIAAIIFHCASAFAWYTVIKNYEDPNFDMARKWLLGLLVVTILIVAGYRAAYNEHRMFEEDVEKAKQESNL